MGELIVRQRRRARHGELAGGIKADEVGRCGGWDRDEHAMMPQHHKAKEQHFDDQQHAAPGNDAIAIQPIGPRQPAQPACGRRADHRETLAPACRDRCPPDAMPRASREQVAAADALT